MNRLELPMFMLYCAPTSSSTIGSMSQPPLSVCIAEDVVCVVTCGLRRPSKPPALGLMKPMLSVAVEVSLCPLPNRTDPRELPYRDRPLSPTRRFICRLRVG